MIGESRIFLANNQLFNSTQNALAAAKEILKQETGEENQSIQ